MKPTVESYQPFQEAYDFFNERLFSGELPACLITFQRQKRIMGYVSLERWVNNQQEYSHELAINPEYFANYPVLEICQTLCHEMVHIWQAHFGTPGRRGYHNMEWARKMMEIGLMPSTTGEPGGETTGEQMMDYILHDGLFKSAFDELAATGFQLTWMDRYPVVRHEKKTITYTQQGKPVNLGTPSPLTHQTMSEGREDMSAAMHTFPYSMEELEAAFDATFPSQTLPASNNIPTTKPRQSSNKHKYRCPRCHMQLWGKPDLFVICGECNNVLVESE